MIYFPFRGFKYFTCPFSSNKKLNKKITPEYNIVKSNILLYCKIFMMKKIKTIKNLSDKTIYTNNLIFNARYDNELFRILAG